MGGTPHGGRCCVRCHCLSKQFHMVTESVLCSVYKVYSAWQCKRPASTVASYLNLITTCMLIASNELLTSGHPIRNQANALFGFVSNQGSHLNW